MERSLEDVLKGAVLLERRGKALYEKAAQTTDKPAVRELFLTLAAEEERHIQMLEGFFREYRGQGKSAEGLEATPERVAGSILTDEVKREITEASYEAAAIYAAMGLEEKAIAYYSEGAEKAASGRARDLFGKLADWERTHLDLLMAIDEDLRQRVWNDQHFWPF